MLTGLPICFHSMMQLIICKGHTTQTHTGSQKIFSFPPFQCNFWTRLWKETSVSKVFVVVLILRGHLLQKEDEDLRETAAFQEEPSRTVFPPDSRLVRGYIQVLSQFHEITAQRGPINRNTNPKQDPACLCVCARRR